MQRFGADNADKVNESDDSMNGEANDLFFGKSKNVGTIVSSALDKKNVKHYAESDGRKVFIISNF